MMPSSSCGKVHSASAKFPARILIVDDEPLVRWSLSAGLRSAGFDAVGASSAPDALKLAREYPAPDVVLLDLRLYDADPWMLLGEFRRIAPRCRFLLLATGGQEMPVPPSEAVTVIEKPFDLAEVVRLVDKTLAATEVEPERFY
jgi:two-component system OmpR family response regulator